MDFGAIKKQIEFYFSDSNYRRDNFLRKTAESDPEGYVPISILLTFNKLKSLTTDPETILKAVEDSVVVSISDDKLKLKRVSDLPVTDDSAARTLYVKGFPTDDSDVNIESISNLFSTYGDILFVKLRRLADKTFKGSCFIEYSAADSVNTANVAANEGGIMRLSFKEKPYDCVLPFTEWLQRKKNKREIKAKSAPGSSSEVVGVKRERDESSEGAKRESAVKDKSTKIDYTERLIIHLSGVPSTATAFTLKDLCKTITTDIKFVELVSETNTAYLRTINVEATDKILEALDKGLNFPAPEPSESSGVVKTEEADAVKMQGRVLTGDEEAAYWKKVGSNSGGGFKNKGGGRGGRGRGRGGRGRGRGGGRGGGRSRD